MAKTGRNDPCSCGSGKKYKYCCYGKDVPSFVAEDVWKEDPEWYKIRLAEGEAVHGILDFGAKKYGEEFLREALEEYSIWGKFPINQEHIESVFIPWATFNWIPGSDNVECSLGLDCLESMTAQFDDYQQRFIRTACSEPYSFFRVTGVVAGKSLALRDLYLNRTFTVKEAQASRTLRRGDAIFARVVPLDGQAIIVGMAPIAIPPSEYSTLLDMRDKLIEERKKEGFGVSPESLLEWDLEMRMFYLTVAEFIADPPRPELRNTDGDPISFIKLYFELHCSPQEAFDALSPLALFPSQEELLEDRLSDANEELLEVRFDWSKKGNKKHKAWDNTIMGTLDIKGGTLTAEVNSEKRARKIQSEITKRLGKRAVFKRAEQESLDAKLEEMNTQSGTPASEEVRIKSGPLESNPEVQAVLREQIEAQWEAWYQQRIPALQNKTPLQAARTKAGRERLEALLREFERSNEDAQLPLLRVDIEAMRKKLGL